MTTVIADLDELKMELRSMEDLYVGSLSAEELIIFVTGIQRGLAYRKYEGVGGFLGCAKVGVTNER